MASRGDGKPDPGEVGTWGVLGAFDSDTTADNDPRYQENELNPNAYVRVYVNDDVGWKTVWGGVPLYDPDGYDLGDAVDELGDKYGPTAA